MLQGLKKRFCIKWIDFALSKKCPNRIPRSGPEGEQIDCFSVYARDDSSRYLIKHKGNDGYHALKFSTISYDIETILEPERLLFMDIQFVHCFGLTTFKFDSILDLAFHQLSKLIYINSWKNILVSNIQQFFFNKSKLHTKRRIELLSLLIEDQLKRPHNGIGVVELMSKIHSIKWVRHPDGEHQLYTLQLYLDSLEASGELRQSNSIYLVTGNGINTLERYEEQERRHKDSVKLQRIMAFLTAALLVIGAIQSRIINIPTLIDFASSP